jgi:hypothetical protein
MSTSTEPEDVREYATVEYWDRRYRSEPSYDWFASAYGETLARILDVLWVRFVDSRLRPGETAAATAAAAAGSEAAALPTVRVLHLGTGNSRLVHDLAAAWYARRAERGLAGDDGSGGAGLEQVAIDYSSVVVEAMRSGAQPAAGPPVRWLQEDCRALSPSVTQAAGGAPAARFDAVIDKGTMDALQADKDSDSLDDDLDAMLREASRVLRDDGGLFIQVTWETAYHRKHITLRPQYGWANDEFSVTPLNVDKGGDSLYRMLTYTKHATASAASAASAAAASPAVAIPPVAIA